MASVPNFFLSSQNLVSDWMVAWSGCGGARSPLTLSLTNEVEHAVAHADLLLRHAVARHRR